MSILDVHPSIRLNVSYVRATRGCLQDFAITLSTYRVYQWWHMPHLGSGWESRQAKLEQVEQRHIEADTCLRTLTAAGCAARHLPPSIFGAKVPHPSTVYYLQMSRTHNYAEPHPKNFRFLVDRLAYLLAEADTELALLPGDES